MNPKHPPGPPMTLGNVGGQGLKRSLVWVCNKQWGFFVRSPGLPPSENFRAKARECLKTAAETTDPLAATLLRMLADDYTALAEEEAVGQQQQQIQDEANS